LRAAHFFDDDDDSNGVIESMRCVLRLLGRLSPDV